MKAIKIMLNQDVQDVQDVQENLATLELGVNGVGYINAEHVSQFYFDDKEIFFVLAGSMVTGQHVNLKFNENSINEYHRIKREFEEAFEINPAEPAVISIA